MIAELDSVALTVNLVSMGSSCDIATATRGFHFICRVTKNWDFLTIWSGGDFGLVPGFCKLEKMERRGG
jgi:hypothetical protein